MLAMTAASTDIHVIILLSCKHYYLLCNVRPHLVSTQALGYREGVVWEDPYIASELLALPHSYIKDG